MLNRVLTIEIFYTLVLLHLHSASATPVADTRKYRGHVPPPPLQKENNNAHNILYGGGKIWRIKENITVGKIKIGELLAKHTPYLIN